MGISFQEVFTELRGDFKELTGSTLIYDAVHYPISSTPEAQVTFLPLTSINFAYVALDFMAPLFLWRPRHFFSCSMAGTSSFRSCSKISNPPTLPRLKQYSLFQRGHLTIIKSQQLNSDEYFRIIFSARILAKLKFPNNSDFSNRRGEPERYGKVLSSW